MLFKLNVILRGVCCSDNVSEDPGFVPILCLQLDESKCNLGYVCEVDDYTSNCKKCNKRCSSVTLFYHNDTLFYSQGSFGKNFHIHKLGEPITGKNMFDV